MRPGDAAPSPGRIPLEGRCLLPEDLDVGPVCPVHTPRLVATVGAGVGHRLPKCSVLMGAMASKVWVETEPEAMTLGRWHEAQLATSARWPEWATGLEVLSWWHLAHSSLPWARRSALRSVSDPLCGSWQVTQFTSHWACPLLLQSRYCWRCLFEFVWSGNTEAVSVLGMGLNLAKRVLGLPYSKSAG